MARKSKYGSEMVHINIYLPLKTKGGLDEKAKMMSCSVNETIISALNAFLFGEAAEVERLLADRKTLSEKVRVLEEEVAKYNRIDVSVFNPEIDKWIDIAERFILHRQATKLAYTELVCELRRQFKQKTTSYQQKKKISAVMAKLANKAAEPNWLVGGTFKNEVLRNDVGTTKDAAGCGTAQDSGSGNRGNAETGCTEGLDANPE